MIQARGITTGAMMSNRLCLPDLGKIPGRLAHHRVILRNLPRYISL